MRINYLSVFKVLIYSVLLYFIYLMYLITVQYIPINYKAAFLSLKQEEIVLGYYKFAFFSHVFSSIIIICAGFTQFSNSLRNSFSVIHKNIGKVYIVLILLIASPSGLIMAFHANGGILAKISFAILAILWFYFTFKAYLFAKNRNFEKHKEFMIRSYALTLSAVTLRLFKFLIVGIFGLAPMDTYKIVSILGWVVNLTLAEVIIKKIRLENFKKT